jgi:hypothetical protein
MKIIIPTCDKYRNIIEANKYTTNKFGGKDLDVTVLGFKKPDFDMGNWKFISLGEDTGPKNFSNDLMKFFNEDFTDEFFIYGNDDIVVVDQIDVSLINDIEKMMRYDETIGRVALTTASIKNFPNLDYYGRVNHHEEDRNVKFELWEAPRQQDDYRLSLHYSIWRTSYFKKYLIPNISPWEWETRSSAKGDGMKILKTRDRYVLDFGHIFRTDRGETNNWHFSEYTGVALSEEDVQFVKNCISKCDV